MVCYYLRTEVHRSGLFLFDKSCGQTIMRQKILHVLLEESKYNRRFVRSSTRTKRALETPAGPALETVGIFVGSDPPLICPHLT